jgi:predicted transposase/invertase (TIGR01784 family)
MISEVKILTLEEEIELIRKEEREEGEYKKAIETAKKLLEVGMDEQKIAEIVGLSLDKVLEIKKNYHKKRNLINKNND